MKGELTSTQKRLSEMSGRAQQLSDAREQAVEDAMRMQVIEKLCLNFAVTTFPPVDFRTGARKNQ